MASRKEILEVGGREVTVTNPDKVYFPQAGYTKLDLVRYFLAVADGALVGVRGRPMALKRFVDGAEAEPFFQKRAPDNRPSWMRTATLTFPSGRTADEIVVDDAAGLAWVVNLGCLDLNPHPVRAEDLEHPDELRVDLDPVPGVPWSQIRDVAMVVREALADLGLRRLAEDLGLARHPHQRAHRAALDLSAGAARRAGAGARRRAAGARDRHLASGGRRSATACSSTTTRTPRTGRWPRPTRCGPLPDARVSFPLRWEEVPRRSTPRTSRSPPCPRSSPSAATRAPGSTTPSARSTALLELSARHEAEGLGDAPWPPNYAKQEGEPPRVQPSRRRRAGRRVRDRPGRGRAVRRPRWPRPRARRRRGGRPQRRPAPGLGGHAPDAHRPSPLVDPGDRDRPRRVEGRGAGRLRALAGAPPRGGRRTSSPRTSSPTGCAAAPRSGTGCGST